MCTCASVHLSVCLSVHVLISFTKSGTDIKIGKSENQSQHWITPSLFLRNCPKVAQIDISNQISEYCKITISWSVRPYHYAIYSHDLCVNGKVWSKQVQDSGHLAIVGWSLLDRFAPNLRVSLGPRWLFCVQFKMAVMLMIFFMLL